MGDKFVHFSDMDLEKKGKVDIEEPTVSVMSAVNTPVTSGYNTPSGQSTPKDERGPEIYELPIIPPGNYTTAPPAALPENPKKQRQVELISFSALLWIIFMEGWNDGTSGPMLPAMQSYYHIGYTVVSMIFVFNCIGFVSGAVANIKLVQKYGFGTTLVIGASFQVVAYCIQAPAPPFPVFAMAYIFSGFGIALQNAGAIVFVINLRNSSAKMGVLQALYGVGALTSPLAATKFASMPHWHYHYIVSLSGAIVNVIVLCLVFRFEHMDTILRKSGQVVHDNRSLPKGGLYGQIFRLKVVHLLAFFALAYVGTEVTIGGWIVTFVMDERNGGASSGYLSSGFFAGLTVGRLALLWFNKLVGERRVVYVYTSLCIALEITIWLVPSLIGNAIAVAFIGFLLGPIYPIITNVAGRLVPHWLLNGAVGWIGGFGQMGSALLPFITGAISSKFGVMSLQPLIVAAMVVMLMLWAAVPPDTHRSE